MRNQITANILNDMYWKRGFTLSQMALELGMKSAKGVSYHMDKFGIKRRSIHDSMPKTPFSGERNEKAYLIGLRAGDIHARRHGRLIRTETTSTKKAQIQMFKESFGKYAEVKIRETKGGYTEKSNKMHSLLDPSFNFLVEKPASIPEWISHNNKYFYSFLAGYCDSEGSWIITQHKKYNGKYKDLVFSLGSCDKTILEQIHQKLVELGFNSHLYMVRKRGVYGERICNFDLHRVMMANRKSVVRLANILLPLSHHEDKKNAKLRIIKYHEMNIKQKLLKRKKLGTIKIACKKCGHKKVWRNGTKKRGNQRHLKYKCPLCNYEFTKGLVISCQP